MVQDQSSSHDALAWTRLNKILDSFVDCDALLIVPPFAGIDRPSLGLHTLQAIAAQVGKTVNVLYANVLFATLIGETTYEKFCYSPTPLLLGERCFSPIAYGKACFAPDLVQDKAFRTALNLPELPNEILLKEIQHRAEDFSRAIAESIANRRFAIVGCSTTFEQTAAAISILNGVKTYSPGTTTIIGGSNCEGAMASGIRQLTSQIDTVFSGESESTFLDYLTRDWEGPRPEIVYGEPARNLNQIPAIEFAQFYEQLDLFLGDVRSLEERGLWLPYETSRGCWWGQKHHCTFCGINGGGMDFREKTADRVMMELPALLRKHPSNRVLMVDNIMPYRYFSELLPKLIEAGLGLHGFYEQKANLSIEKVALLKSAGFSVIQPGIEALSTHMLELMKKGVTGEQNIALLRYARTLDVSVNWNLLYAFPGDMEEDYAETLELIPLISHLAPPAGACHLSIDRFSPYFDRPEEYGVTKVRPMDAYFEVLPSHVDASMVGYHFLGDYESAVRRNPTIAKELNIAVEAWRNNWNQSDTAPTLRVEEIADDIYLLADSRPAVQSSAKFQFITTTRARIAISAISKDKVEDGDLNWALNIARVAVLRGSMLVPLAVASYELIRRFERRSSGVQSLRDIAVAVVPASSPQGLPVSACGDSS